MQARLQTLNEHEVLAVTAGRDMREGSSGLASGDEM